MSVALALCKLCTRDNRVFLAAFFAAQLIANEPVKINSNDPIAPLHALGSHR